MSKSIFEWKSIRLADLPTENDKLEKIGARAYWTAGWRGIALEYKGYKYVFKINPNQAITKNGLWKVIAKLRKRADERE
ncbi:MAG: hypothetical protein QXU98_05735 [Candidatus Parvarchaeota archaeon]